MLLSLFCGPGGLDLGFEQAGFDVRLAFDKNPDSIATYNANRAIGARGHVRDVRSISPDLLDELVGHRFQPRGIIGGPPCQSFSQANQVRLEDDPRHTLPLAFADLLAALNSRAAVDFFVMENVTGLASRRHQRRLEEIILRFEQAGFAVESAVLNAADYSIPQKRRRLFLVGFNKVLFPGVRWAPPAPTCPPEKYRTVADTIRGLPEPTFWSRELRSTELPLHPNHWCMSPKSPKFHTPGSLTPGNGRHRSFKTLRWDQPSITVAYGNREVHVHPDCHRRLSVFEAMLLQSFPKSYVLQGSLSSQIAQVSEAVPPLLALAVAKSVGEMLEGFTRAVNEQRELHLIPGARPRRAPKVA